MKKRYLFASALALLAATGLASCGSKKDDNPQNEKEEDLESISIDFAKTEYVLGEKFDSTALVVMANYKNGEKKDVTANATVTPFSTDLTTAGSYTVTVTYEGKTTNYTFTVVAPNNVKTLKALDVKTSSAKTKYTVGDKFSLDNVALFATYSNSTTTADTVEYITDLKDYTIEVTDKNGEVVADAFEEAGTYTVTIAKGEIKGSYKVVVNKANALSVADAIQIGAAKADKISGGSYTKETTNTSKKNGKSSESYNYAFGDNHTQISYEEYGINVVEHYSLDENEEIFAVKETIDGEYKTLSLVDGTPMEEMMRGIKFSSIFGSTGSDTYIYYGVEELLEELYKEAKKNENSDFKEECIDICTHCGMYNRYSFEFSKLFKYFYQEIVDDEPVNVDIISAVYKIRVEFSLGDSNQFEDITITSSNYATFDYEHQKYFTGYVADMENGTIKMPEDATPDFITEFTIHQNAGARNVENEFSKDKVYIASYDLKDEENNILTEDSAVIELNYGDSLVLKLDNVLPTTASVNFDRPEVVSDWFTNWKAYDSFDSETNTLTLTFYTVGTQEIKIKTNGTTKKIKVSIPLLTPTQISSEVLQENGEFDKRFVNTNNVTLYLDGDDATLWFKSYVGGSEYDGSYSAELVGESTNATLSETTQTIYENDIAVVVNVHEFKATALGTYYVKITSALDDTVVSTLTIVVAEKPSISDVLKGTYAYSNSMFGITVKTEFTPSTEGAVDGTMKLTYETSDWWTGATTSQIENFSYTYSEENGLAIVHTDGETIDSFDIRLNANLSLEAYILNDWRELEKQKDINIPESFYGKYICTISEDEKEIIVISSDGVTINNVSIAVKASDESSITLDYYGDTVLTINEDGNLEDAVMGFVYIKQEEQGLVVPESMFGKYTNSDGSIVISAETIKETVVEMGSSTTYTYTITSCDGNTLTGIDETNYPITIVFNEDYSAILVNDYLSYEKANGNDEEEIVIPSNFIGTYENDNYTIVITEDEVTINGTKVEVTEADDYQGLTVIYGETNDTYYIYQYGYDSVITKICFASEDNSVFETLTKTSGSDEPGEVNIPQDLVGTYTGTKDEVTYTVVITTNSITINDEAVTDIEVINYFGVSLSFTYNSNIYGLVPTDEGMEWTDEVGNTFTTLTKQVD